MYFHFILLWIVAISRSWASDLCHPLVKIENPKFFSNGSVLDINDKSQLLYSPGAYLSSRDGTYFGCVCSVKTCVQKCCFPDQLTRGEKLRCSPIRNNVRGSFQLDGLLSSAQVDYWTPCNDMEIVKDNNILLYANGSFNSSKVGYVDTTRYCWEYVEQLNRTYPFVCTDPGQFRDLGLIIALLLAVTMIAICFYECWRKCLWCLY